MIPFTGRALGLDDKVGGTAVTEQLSPSGGVLLYTDGLIEARGESFRYGIERAVEVLRIQTGATPTAVISHLIRDVQAFAGQQLTDDICLMAFRAPD